MIITHQKPILCLIFLYRLWLPFFSPVCKPSWVNFTTKKIAFLFKSFDIVELNLWDPIIDTNIGSSPMTLLNIFNPINIVLFTLYFEIEPNFAKGFNISFIISIETILVLNLKHNNWTFRVGSCLQMFVYNRHQGLEIYFDLL